MAAVTRNVGRGRREFLRGLGLGALSLGALGAVTGPAAAVTALDQGDYRAALDRGCGDTAYHRQMLDEMAAKLGVSLTQAQRAQVLGAFTCPTCGCPLTRAAAGDGAF